MPIFRPQDIVTDTGPETPNVCGPYQAKRFSDAGGLTQFGAFTETLPPGSRSSIKHWHAGEDEFVYMLDGEVLLHEGDARTTLHPGDTASFKAGVAQGHCLENVSDAPATYLVVGTRSDGDVVTYPDDNRVLEFDRSNNSRRWSDHEGNDADNPYLTRKMPKT